MSNQEWNLDRERGMENALSGAEPDYLGYHVNLSLLDFNLAGKRVLVVGCNRGGDCRPFIDLGAEAVVGLDIMDEIGVDFSHERVSYIKETAEKMSFFNEEFDFVFSFATLEHVPDVGSAFKEIARVTKTGGKIYTVASPLWCNRQGPHWGSVMNFEPWIHLRFGVEEIVQIVEKRRLQGLDVGGMNVHSIRYLMDTKSMNQLKSSVYVDSCATLQGITIERNELQVEPYPGELGDVIKELESLGYSEKDLLAMTHVFIARKL